MLVPSKEGKACDAVLRLIEICAGAKRSGLWHPELEEDGPPVDLRVMVGSREYAIEHTLLQPYPDRIRYGAAFNRIYKFIQKRIPSPLPGFVHYELYIPIQINLPKGKKRSEQALQNLLEWTISSALRLHDRRRDVPPAGYFLNNSIRGRPDGFEQDFELFRWPDGLPSKREPGALFMGFSALEDDEQPFKHALDEAFDKKFPKLNGCKRLGVRTVLVLEVFDPPFGHRQHIGSLLSNLLTQRTDCPDEIYLVEPHEGVIRWWVWPIKRDVHHWPVAGVPVLEGSFFPLGERPPNEMSEWYRQFNYSLEDPKHIPLDWHPAFFKEEELNNLTENKVTRPSYRHGSGYQ